MSGRAFRVHQGLRAVPQHDQDLRELARRVRRLEAERRVGSVASRRRDVAQQPPVQVEHLQRVSHSLTRISVCLFLFAVSDRKTLRLELFTHQGPVTNEQHACCATESSLFLDSVCVRMYRYTCTHAYTRIHARARAHRQHHVGSAPTCSCDSMHRICS
jgi:hypothetical protein